jgi:hypothetical protein
MYIVLYRHDKDELLVSLIYVGSLGTIHYTVSAIEDLLSMMHDDNSFFSMLECLALLEH